MRALAASVVLCALAAWAEESVPAPLALKVMLKVTSYDAAFGKHGEGDFVVAVPFVGAGDEAAAAALVAIGAGLDVQQIHERPLKFVAVPVRELEGRRQPAAVLLHAGFSPDALTEVLRAAKARGLYVLAMDESAVQAGATLGVALNNGKPQPLINIANAHALQADFGAALRLARTVQ